MYFIMNLNTDEVSAFKLARLKALTETSQNGIIEKILDQEGDINFEIPVSSPYRFSKPHLIGYTALHFAYTKDNIDLFKSLLDRGADFTRKNKDDETALHLLIAQERNIKEHLDNPFINAVLSAHVTSKNISNPCNKDGLSHFHVACMTNHSRAVQFFLDNGVSVDEPLNINAKFSPGYTPLHLAAMYTSTKVAEILIAQGANVHAAEVRKMTPLHLLLEQRLEMYDLIKDSMFEQQTSHEKLRDQIWENEKIIKMLLDNTSIDNNRLDSIGLSTFHVTCTLRCTSVAQHLVDRVTDLDHCVNIDSRLWPGYTALHFAAHVSIRTVERLIKNGANIEAKDSQGLTPLDICIDRYEVADVCRIMSFNANWQNILFSDCKTRLLSFIRALADHDQPINDSFHNTNMWIPMESPLWPGYTPLHLAVLFAERPKRVFYDDREAENGTDLRMIRSCLKHAADPSLQDSRGQTALHLAFRLNKMRAVDEILLHCHRIPNVLDENGLSHFHIVCAVSREPGTFKKCAPCSSEVNAVYKGTSPINNFIRPGWTTLHARLAYLKSKKKTVYTMFSVDSRKIVDLDGTVKILLDLGADPCAMDAYGLTPVHWLLDRDPSSKTELLLGPETEDRVAEEYGLSHLHVACHLDDHEAVKRLIERGANVNLAIEYTRRSEDDPLSFLSRYDKCTPLHMARNNAVVCRCLVEHGADVFALKADGSIASDSAIVHYFDSKVSGNSDLESRKEREFGWTKLHLACFLLRIDGFDDIIRAESTNVNARVFSNSPVWKGFTPLHLLMHSGQHYYNTEAYTMSKMLLDNGADVTLIDEEQNTPINMLFNYFANEKKPYEQARLLLTHHSDFNVNPVNAQGVSHFHVACFLNDVDAVRGFLEHGAKVRRPIDFLADWSAGCTPLHLASQLRVVDLLLGHGADIHIEDVQGRTVLHKAVMHDVFDENVIVKLIESGAGINRPNFKGETPFEIAISSGKITVMKLLFFIRHGFIVNSCNPISGVGYAAIILGSSYENVNSQKLIVERMLQEKSTNALGRTSLHHLVTGQSPIKLNVYDDVLLEHLIDSGHDVDQQDNEGKTALHLAVEFGNRNAVYELLNAGADVNVLDTHGKSAFSYLYENRHIKSALIAHACKLVLLNLDLAEVNADAVSSVPEYLRDVAGHDDFFEQVAASKDIKLGVGSMCLADFLKETGAVIMYPTLNHSERGKIDEYFESVNRDSSLKEIRGFLQLQHRKAVKRIELLSSATNSFRLILGFHLPDLCIENIFQYLHNYDLKNIITAEIENTEMRMDMD